VSARRRVARGDARERRLYLRERGRRPVEARGGAVEDRRGPPPQGVPLGRRAERAVVDPRPLAAGRQGSPTRRARGPRVRPLRARRVSEAAPGFTRLLLKL